MIRAENLSMHYGSVRALVDASFEVRRGEVLGLLGPNGAGKTTTLKILTTSLSPTEGRVLIDGVDIAEQPVEARRRIGYLPETAPLYVDMLVADYLRFAGAARGLREGDLKRRLDAVVGSCSLESVCNRPISQLSKGFRQRVGLAQALIHDPEILILDEPTSGLDPIQILGIRDLVRSLSGKVTILFSTHILQEIEAVSDRVLIINGGRIIAAGTPRELERRAMGADRLVVEASGDSETLEGVLASVPGILAVQRAAPTEPGAVAFHLAHAFDDDAAVARVEEALRQAGAGILRLTHDRYSLEQVFVSLVRERAAAPEAA